MGVLNPKNKETAPVQHVINYNDYIFSDSESDSSTTDQDAQAILTALNVNKKKKSKPTRAERVLQRTRNAAGRLGEDGVRISSGMGARRRRRMEAASMVLSSADRDDICDDFSDLVPDTINAFTRLFLDDASMKVWQEFASKDDEGQQRFINQLNTNDGIAASGSDEEEGFEMVNVVGGSLTPPSKKFDRLSPSIKRQQHPVFSAHACFERLSSRAKSSLLKKRGVPYDVIDDIELTLRQYFKNSPNGVWVDVVDNPNSRMYIHSVAAFLSLASGTFAGSCGTKILEIKNKKSSFIPPNEMLVPYIHRRLGKSLYIDAPLN